MFPFHIHRPEAALTITVEPHLTRSAMVTVTGPDGERPPFLTTFREALLIASALAELPSLLPSFASTGNKEFSSSGRRDHIACAKA